MQQLDYEALNERLSQLDRRAKLVRYIFEVQGFELKRLNYDKAGEAVGVDWTTIKRYCDELADKKIIVFEGKGLKLNDELAI